MSERPKLNKEMDSEIFRDFYYLKEELVDFCRANDLPVSGNKMELTERIACFLATGEIVAASVKSVRNANVGEITENTVIESDIVCSQKHRAFFREKIGKRIALSNAEIMIHQPAIHGNGN